MKSRPEHENQLDAKREEIDPVFKEVMSFCFRRLGISLQTEVEVSRIPRTIDALIVLEQDDDVQKVHSQTPFGHFQTYNQIEFKGVRDPLTRSDYYRVLGRAYLYVGENDIPPEQMTVTIICARKPRKFLAQSDFRPVIEGHYQTNIGLPARLIVINELPIETPNYPLLLFASSMRKFRAFLQRTLEADILDYISFAYHLHPQLTKEVLTMAGRHQIPKKDLEFMAKDIGPELLPFLSPEQRLEGLSLAERLRGLSADELRKLDAEERRLIEQLLARLAKDEQNANN